MPSVGSLVELFVGVLVEMFVGCVLGSLLGLFVGVFVGIFVGVTLGDDETISDGDDDGDTLGGDGQIPQEIGQKSFKNPVAVGIWHRLGVYFLDTHRQLLDIPSSSLILPGSSAFPVQN